MRPDTPAPIAAIRIIELMVSSAGGSATDPTFLTASGRLGSPRVAACAGDTREREGVSSGVVVLGRGVVEAAATTLILYMSCHNTGTDL